MATILDLEEALTTETYVAPKRGSVWTKFIGESLDVPLAKSFVNFVMAELDISIKPPKITLTDNLKKVTRGLSSSFGSYDPDKKEILVYRGDRHRADILRTLAHELVHFHQDISGQELNGGDGSATENEANSMAGVLMRRFVKVNPDILKTPITEKTPRSMKNEKMLDIIRNPQKSKPSDRQWATNSLSDIYASETPGQEHAVLRAVKEHMHIDLEDVLYLNEGYQSMDVDTDPELLIPYQAEKTETPAHDAVLIAVPKDDADKDLKAFWKIGSEVYRADKDAKFDSMGHPVDKRWESTFTNFTQKWNDEFSDWFEKTEAWTDNLREETDVLYDIVQDAITNYRHS